MGFLFFAIWLKCVYVCTSELAICFGIMSIQFMSFDSKSIALSANELWAFMKFIAYAWTISFALNPRFGFQPYQKSNDNASTIISLAKWIKWSLCIVFRLLTFLLNFHDDKRNGIWCNFYLLAMRFFLFRVRMRKKIRTFGTNEMKFISFSFRPPWR